MVTPINAVRFHSDFVEAEWWLRRERPARSFEPGDENLAPARGAILGLLLGGLMWAGIIVAVRALLSL